MKSFQLCFYTLLGVLIQVNKANAQSVTFSEHIAPIIYKHCTSCHRPGEIGPFPLTNYQEVSSYANTIQAVVESGYMPPWKADPTYQRYQKENFLTSEQKQLISDWVNQGAQQGNPDLLPPLPVFPSGSQVGVPDLVLSFAQSYNHEGNNTDSYHYFVLPTGLTETKKIKAVEFRPGNPRIVHHALIWEDTTGEARAADLATPEYGYSGAQGGGTNLGQMQLPAYVPGAQPVVYSNGITQLLHAGSDLKIQVHYAPTSTNETDSSTVNIFFENENANRILRGAIMVPIPGILQNGPFEIPANQTREFHGKFNVPVNVSLYSVSPHSHLLGTHWKVYAVEPNGDTIPIISIPEWDFNWQGSYQFKRLIKVSAGSVIHAFAGYDNTVNNIYNPNSPPQLVTWGEGTADEMFYLPINYLIYQPGDENIIFEDETIGIADLIANQNNRLTAFPNPSSGVLNVGFTLSSIENIDLNIVDIKGKRLVSIESNKLHLQGYHTKEIDISNLDSGVYFVELLTNEAKRVSKVVLVK